MLQSHTSASSSSKDANKAPLRLRIIVVGAGLGGLAAAHTLARAGHSVTILESAKALGEVGAGIQVSPNVSRLLLRWGLGPDLERDAVRPEAIVFRRYATGERVGYARWGDKILNEFGVPYLHVHRADFHAMLFSLVEGRVEVRLDSTVVGCDPAKPSVTLSTGEVIEADLIVGADGVKSKLREIVVGEPTPATPTGDAAYRAIIPAQVLLDDPELRPFIETPEMTGWMAPGRHLMAYPIRGKKEYNLVLLHPDDGSVESWTAEGSADKMRADFADFEPRVQKMLSHVQSTLKWRLMDRLPLDTWVHPNGRLVLLGDSCHPMLPYRAQGAAMAIEDAGVLGKLFEHVSHPSHIAPLLRAYEHLRYARASNTQNSSRDNQRIFHLPDGPAQEERDEQMRMAMSVELANGEKLDDLAADAATKGNPNQWADRSKNRIQFGYDAEAEAEGWYEREGRAALAKIDEEVALKEKARL